MKLKIRLETYEDKVKASKLSKEYPTLFFDNYLLIDTKKSLVAIYNINLDDFINEPIMWRWTLNILYYTQLSKNKKVDNILIILIRISLLITLIYFIFPFWTCWIFLISILMEIYNLIKTIWKN